MTPELSRGIDALRRRFGAEIANGDIRHLGTYNCRRKNNSPTGPWSEHAWPNAVDVMIRNFTGRKALGDRIAAWGRANPSLWSETFWWIQYHFDHVHLTANPRRNHNNRQVPPCAGGPAIQKEDVMNASQEAKLDQVLALVNALPSNVLGAEFGGPHGSTRRKSLSLHVLETKAAAVAASNIKIGEDGVQAIVDAIEAEGIAKTVWDELARRLS